MSQVDRVLTMLRDAGPRGVCSETFYASRLPNARNRIAVELRDRGFVIERGPCAEHVHGATQYFRYVLVHDPERQPLEQAAFAFAPP